ncbi:MAG TPA: DEAD/DEAH box helicase, partial [Planctomycetota bacterium]|nr:DEAD/DEAH box helicase [Planctomycetota bacterium]
MPSTTWRMLATMRAGRKLPSGLDAAWEAAVGFAGKLKPRTRGYLRRAARVVRLEKHFAGLTDAKLREEADAVREVVRRNRETPGDLERAFAVVRETAVRQIGERPFPVQVAGALALHDSCIVEMATGEGKTLAATLPAAVAGWRGRGCHIITVNDYLARRDAEWMGKIYRFLGLSVAWVEQKMSPPDRQAAYNADITYCTNKEVTADFLRDRLTLGRVRGLPSALLGKIAEGRASRLDRVVQRGLTYAIVDEADSVLIDEAVTPLIISGDAPNPEQVEAFTQGSGLAAQLEEGRHYRVNHRYREVELTSTGKKRVAELTEPLGGVWSGRRRSEELVVQALTARAFYRLDQQYVVDEGKVVIVDEFTGRLMPDRTWRDGLHQAIEAKETLTVNPPKDTYARISFQRFFRTYPRLAGMTGTAAEGWREFWQIYNRRVVVIPTNRPCIRTVLGDRVYATEDAKWHAVVTEIARLNASGRPILVGTRSVRASEHLSSLLAAQGLEHAVLNAVRHREEAQIVAGA